MSNRKYNLLKALSWYTVGNLLIKSISFFTIRLFTSLMSTGDFGIYGLFQSYQGIMEIVILFGTSHTVKMAKYDDGIDYDQYISSILLIPVVGTLISALSVGGVFLLYGEIGGLDVSIWLSIVLTAGLSSIANVLTSKLILDGNYRRYILYCFVNSIVNIGVSVLLCYTVFYKSEVYWARIVGGIVSSVLGCAFLLFSFRLKKVRLVYIKTGIVYGAPLLVHAAVTQVLVQSDKIIISKMFTYNEVGIYSAATNIAIIPMTLLGSIENSWSPWFFKKLKERDYENLKKNNSKILCGFAGIISIFILVIPEVVHFITDEKYWDAVYVVIPLSIVAFAELAYLMPLNLEIYYKKNNAIWIYTVMIVIINIVLDIWCIHTWGYIAAAYVTCFSRFCLFILHYFRSKRIDRNDILSIKILLLTVISIVAVSILCLALLNQILIRWSLVFTIMILVLFMVKNMKMHVE